MGNPLGNPTYPGYTSSNGPNWIDFLTVTYNASKILTYNLAYGGATVDSDLVTPYAPTVISLKNQIRQEYIPTYGSHPASAPWKSSDTLFSIFIGINDVGNSYYASNSTQIKDAIFKLYSALVEDLYTTGARNFLFLNVPPVDRSPLTVSGGTYSTTTEKADIADFNARIVSMVANLTRVHPDSTSFIFDTNALFTQVLDNPKSTPQTSGYKNTTNYCTDYMNGTPAWDTLDADCGIPVNQYFWLNTLHPTYPVHNATAAAIAKQLASKAKNVKTGLPTPY